jgi:hypothetical protein
MMKRASIMAMLIATAAANIAAARHESSISRMQVTRAVTALSQLSCVGRCVQCSYNVMEFDQGTPLDSPFRDQDCIYQGFCVQQGGCKATFDLFGAAGSDAIALVRQAARSDDAGAITQFIRTSSRVHYNASRHAVQVVGCNGRSIIASFPVAVSIQTAAAAARYASRAVGEID